MIIPNFQRKYVWNRSQASRLIESLIIQCPIPVIYLAQDTAERLSVVDGNQRLKSIQLYVNDGFKLRGLTAYPELTGLKFNDLDPRFQRHILNRTLRCLTIMKETHPRIKFDVFERLNTGAVQLNAQELRHGLMYGRLMEHIDELTKQDVWKQLTGISLDKRMRSAELILRFFALLHAREEYKKPLEGFLNDFCESNRDPDVSTLGRWTADFIEVGAIVKSLFGEFAFRQFDSRLTKRQNINAALFDAEMIGVAVTRPRVNWQTMEERQNFLEAVADLLVDPQFKRSITAATSDESSVQFRIGRFTQFLKSIF